MGTRLFIHFKNGKVYQYLGRALHTETNEQLVLYTEYTWSNNGLASARIFARPKDMFFGTVSIDGTDVRRFAELNDAQIQTLFSEKYAKESV